MPSTYLSLNTHIIFATKGRAPMIGDAWRHELHGYIAGTVRGLGATSFATGGVSDHVHLLAGLKATHCVADFVRDVKRASSIWASERYDRFAWQVGYAALSIRASEIPVVSAYIGAQEEHHRTISSSDELRALLTEFGIPIDERFFE